MNIKYFAKLKHIKPEHKIILIIVLIKMLILGIADLNSGFDGDEVMYIDAGRHLSWGYMEVPPMIGFLAWIQNLLNSHSIFVHHIFVHIASALIIVFCGLITIKLGGQWKAVLMALSCILLAPGFGITHNAFQPVIFDQLFWVLCFYFLICFVQENNDRYIFYLSLAAAFGFLSKYSIVFFIIGLFFSILFHQPTLFKKRIVWISLITFLIIISPNIYWQIKNDFPAFKHFDALYKLIDKISYLENIKLFFLSLNPFTIFIWFTGIFIIPFIQAYKNYRLVFYTILLSFIILSISRGRFYYFYPIVLASLGAGSVFIEYSLMNRKRILTIYITILLLSGFALIPFGLPVIPLKQYIKFLGLKKQEDGRIPIQFESRYTKEAWNNLTEEVSIAFQQLSSDEKKKCLIWASDYTQAGVINFFGYKYGLPKAFSFISSYYLWVPTFDRNYCMLTIQNSYLIDDYKEWISYYNQFFEKVELSGHVYCPYARQDNNVYYHIFICKGLKCDSQDLKKIFKAHIFN